ncbi:MAG: hypothetical protein ABIT64_03230 [Lysobacteraceae bacterium]
MSKQPANTDPKTQRARARRTVWVLAAVAAAIYVGFILQAVLHK